MSLDFNASPTAPAALKLEIPEGPKKFKGWIRFAIFAVIVGAGVLAWQSGVQLTQLWGQNRPSLESLLVDEGELEIFVTENGVLESADNATVRCQVEALIGQVGGAQGQGGMQSGGRGGQGGQGGQGGGAGGAQGGNPQQAQAAAIAAQQAAQKKAGMPKVRAGARKPSASASKKSSSATAPAPGGAAPAAGGAAPAAGGGGASAGGGMGGAGGGGGGGAGGAAPAAGAGGAAPVGAKPMIRSFSYQVPPHMPLRPKVAVQAVSKQQAVDPAQLGGRGGRGGGGRGGQQQSMEKPGSTRIISILPEGTRVKQGDIVCELDSAPFRDELQSQMIRYNQAEAWVTQAKSILESNEITLSEYRDGIHPQDIQILQNYVKTCEVENERATKNAEWSRAMVAKGFRAKTQLDADLLALQQTEIALTEAKGMQVRLEKFTAPRLLKALEAKNEAIKADLLTQEAAFALERERRDKLQKMVDNCTLRAPRDGIVVYHNQSNSWGRMEAQIQEGMTVREGQPIFDLPNPQHMQVRARINETKLAQVKEGMSVSIRLDAFPDRILRGKVSEVMPISAPANGPTSDVRIYYAVIDLESEFDELRPGLSAEVDFYVGTLSTVTRVPLQAVRHVKADTYVVVKLPPSKDSSGPRWRWAKVQLGASNENFAEVLAGLKPGDKVLAHPEQLPAPRLERSAPAVAQSSTAPSF